MEKKAAACRKGFLPFPLVSTNQTCHYLTLLFKSALTSLCFICWAQCNVTHPLSQQSGETNVTLKCPRSRPGPGTRHSLMLSWTSSLLTVRGIELWALCMRGRWQNH